MAKKSKLLAQTDPENLKKIVVGTFLAVFVFIGSFAVADSAVFLIQGKSTLSASAFGCYRFAYCLDKGTTESDDDDDDGAVPGYTGDDGPADPQDLPPSETQTQDEAERQAEINEALRQLDEQERQGMNELNSVPTNGDPAHTGGGTPPPTGGGTPRPGS